MAEDKQKEWEQPWPPGTIRQQSAKWNLAGDAGLLLHLRQASADVMSRLETTKKNVNDLSINMQNAAIRLNGAINDFSRLANNQFIENRVYDDDAKPNRDVPVEKEIVNTKEQREAEMVGVMKNALEKGCVLMDSYYTKIEIRSYDFDEDDDPTFAPQPVFESKDPYACRPLPYVIATPDFIKSECVGLREDEEELAAGTKQEELSESDDDTKSSVSDAAGVSVSVPEEPPELIPPVSSSAKPIAVAVSPVGGKAASDSSSSGLFGTSADSGESAFPNATSTSQRAASIEDTSVVVRPPPVHDFRSELENRLARSTRPGPVERGTTTAATKANAPRSLHDTDDERDILFSPPPLSSSRKDTADSDDDGGLFKPRSRGLFDADEDEPESKPAPLPRSMLQQMVDHSEKPMERSTAVKPATTSNQEQQKFDASVPKSISMPTAASTSSAAAPFMKDKGPSMFTDNSDDDDDDLFGRVYKKRVEAPVSKPGLVQDNEKKPTTLPLPKQSTGAFGTGSTLFDDEDDDDDLFSMLKRPKKQELSKTMAGKDVMGDKPPIKDIPVAPKTISPTVINQADIKTASTSYRDSGGSTIPVPATNSLFSDSNSPPSSRPAAVANASTFEKKSVAGRGLFSDDSDDDPLFPKATSVVEKSQVKNSDTRGPDQKRSFVTELSKKLASGPQSMGFVKQALPASDNPSDQSDSSIPARKTSANVDDMFKPPAHGLFGYDEEDKVTVDKVDKVVNLDDDAQAAETLPSLIKNRAKLPNRRPPSKHATRVEYDADGGVDAGETRDDAKQHNHTERGNEESKARDEVTDDQVDSRGSINADPLGAGAGPLTVDTPSAPVMESIGAKQTTIRTGALKEKHKTKAVIFKESDEDDLFGIVKTKQRPTMEDPKKNTDVGTAEQKKTVTAGSGQQKVGGMSGGGLFSDEDEDDLFADTKRLPPKKANVSTFKQPVIENKSVQSKSSNTKKTTASSLFDDDDDDDDVDIFR